MALLILYYIAFLTWSFGIANPISGIEFESLQTFLKTKYWVCDVQEDVFVPGNILYSDFRELMTTNGVHTHLIVGSYNGYGYSEGKGADAKFRDIRSVLQINFTHTLLVDEVNNCLRWVNRQTNVTSHFVGVCGYNSRGFKDGRYGEAMFYFPLAVIKNNYNPQTVIITDMSNNALRTANIITGDVKTLVKLPSDPRHTLFDSNNEDLFITFYNFLGKYNLKTSSFLEITPMKNNDGRDGPFSVASFRNARVMLLIRKDLLIVADEHNNKVRVVDLGKQVVHSVCSVSGRSVDGPVNTCSFASPHSLLLKNGVLYIGEGRAIRSIRLTDTALKTRVEFTASYQVSCKQINNPISINMAILKMTYIKTMLENSGYCKIPSVINTVVSSCNNDLVKVNWVTDCIFSKQQSKELDAALMNMKANLRQDGVNRMEIYVSNHVPQVITPSVNEEGLPASIILTNVCVDGGVSNFGTKSC